MGAGLVFLGGCVFITILLLKSYRLFARFSWRGGMRIV
jgi:hypothetical protein